MWEEGFSPNETSITKLSPFHQKVRNFCMTHSANRQVTLKRFRWRGVESLTTLMLRSLIVLQRLLTSSKMANTGG